MPWNIELLDRFPDDLLADAVRVHVSRVPRVETSVPGAFEELEALLLLNDPVHPVFMPERHGAEDGNRHAETGLAELSIRDLSAVEAVSELFGHGFGRHGGRYVLGGNSSAEEEDNSRGDQGYRCLVREASRGDESR